MSDKIEGWRLNIERRQSEGSSRKMEHRNDYAKDMPTFDKESPFFVLGWSNKAEYDRERSSTPEYDLEWLIVAKYSRMWPNMTQNVSIRYNMTKYG